VSISAVHSLQCCVSQCSAQFAVLCQSVQCTVCSVVSVSAVHSFSHETSTFCLRFLSVVFFRAPEVNHSLYFRETRFDVAASAQTDQQFCDFMRIREYAETDNSREEAQRTNDLRECRFGMGKRWLVN